MKDLVKRINEGKNWRLYSETQNEVDKNGEYHTYTITDGKKKFKKGFLTFNDEGEFFTITAFNTAKEFAEMLGADEDTYNQYNNIKVGGCIEWGDTDGTTTQILRIW